MSDIPNWFVVCMGIGTVFVGLICIIILCKIMSLFFYKKSQPTLSTPEKSTEQRIENRGEIIAAVCAACAEELGKDVSALRVVSFKKL